VTSYPVFSFLSIRFTIATAALLPFALLRHRGRTPGLREISGLGSSCAASSDRPGIVAGFGFQTLGLELTTPAKAGFVTGLYVVLVPMIGGLFLRQAPGRSAWLGWGLQSSVGPAHLALRLTHQSGRCPGLWLRRVLCHPYPAHGRFARVTIRFCSLWAGRRGRTAVHRRGACPGAARSPGAECGPGGCLHRPAGHSGRLRHPNGCQRFTTPTHTALIFAAEPVFAALASYVIIGELLGPRQLVGCG